MLVKAYSLSLGSVAWNPWNLTTRVQHLRLAIILLRCSVRLLKIVVGLCKGIQLEHNCQVGSRETSASSALVHGQARACDDEANHGI
jgi:hypothetical protein